MGGGPHNPDSEIDDQQSVSKASVSGANSSHHSQGHGNMDRDFGEAYSYIAGVGGHRGHGPGRNSSHDDMLPSTRSVPGGAQGGGERMDSVDSDRNQSRAEGGVHQSAHGYRGSEHSKPGSVHDEGRHRSGSEQGSRRPVADADISSTAGDSSRFGSESREGARMTRGMGPSSNYDDLPDYAGDESDRQLSASRRGHHCLPTGHGHHPSRYHDDDLEPPSHYHRQYYAAEMSEHQPRGSRHGPWPPPAGHGGHPGRHAHDSASS